MTYLVAIDPGPHCGVAIFKDNHYITSTTVTDRGSDNPMPQDRNASPKLQQYLHLRRLLHEFDQRKERPLILIESYATAKPLTRDGIATLHLIGWLWGECSLWGLKVVFAPPSARVPFVDDAKRYDPATPHEQSAIAHALAYFANHEHR